MMIMTNDQEVVVTDDLPEYMSWNFCQILMGNNMGKVWTSMVLPDGF